MAPARTPTGFNNTHESTDPNVGDGCCKKKASKLLEGELEWKIGAGVLPAKCNRHVSGFRPAYADLRERSNTN